MVQLEWCYNMEMVHTRLDQLIGEEEQEGQYQYTEYPVTPPDGSKHCIASFYTIPPGKSNYPYHYHLGQEELFYIISGIGIVKTPDGTRDVKGGDVLFFPAGECGAHKLTNTSKTEPLVYLDVDTIGDVDVAVYPDSGKVGIWSDSINGTWKKKDRVAYYDGESDAQ